MQLDLGGNGPVLSVLGKPVTKQQLFVVQNHCAGLAEFQEGEDLRHAGDIRSGNIDHIIQAKMVMSDYLTCVLPDGVREDVFEAGEYMGTRFFADAGEDGRVIGSFCIETPHHRMRTNMVEEYEELALGSTVMQRTLEQIDKSERQLYIALITRENSGVQYRLYVDADFITEEDFLTVTESVEMEENAFY